MPSLPSARMSGGEGLRGRAYVLALTAAVYFFYLLDRNAVLVTQELVKQEFGLTDTQVGLTTGVLYGIAYALVGLPLGRLIDRTHRGRLLALLVALWSGVTLLCGFATRFWHLATARFIVGAAESGGAPTSLSILSDLYPPERRAAVSSIFFAGAGIGGIVSFLAGGYIAANWGWRAVFLIYGAPGLLLAGLIALTVRDPRRAQPVAPESARGFWATIGMLTGDRALFPVYCGAVLYAFCNSGIGAWMIPYLMRVHHLPVTEAGIVVALCFGVLSTIGSITFGFAADALERRFSGGMLALLAIAAIFNGAAGLSLALAPTFLLAVVALSFWGLSGIVYSGPVNAAIARLAPSGTTGTAFALFAVLCNLIGAGLGPLFVGMTSDGFQTMGGESIRPALGLVALVQLATPIMFLCACWRWRGRFGARRF